MALIKRADLVMRGSELLDEAKNNVSNGSEHALAVADRKIAIASAYARLAEALDAAAFAERTAGANW